MAHLPLFLIFLGFTSAVLIPNLPNQPPVKFKQYSDYYSVGTNGNHQLHYWFLESQNNPSTDPVLLWLTGGPGCSGFSAVFGEWGPFTVNGDGASLSLNPYSWNRNASMLVFESPAGVGYSYSKDGNVRTGDDQTASENWEGLKAFFTEFSQYQKNDFYITGESYGGVYVPTLAQTILDRQSQFQINIKGFAIGNGLVSADTDTDGLVQFTHKHGLIDQLQYQKAQTQCCTNGNMDDCPFHNMNGFDFCGSFVNNAVNMAWRGGLNPYNMYGDCVNSALAQQYQIDLRRKFGPVDGVQPHQLSTPPCVNESAVTVYMNRRDVRVAFAVPGLLGAWSICSDQVSQEYRRQYDNVSSQVKNALSAGLKVMLYYGDIDMACNFMGGQKFTAGLGLTQVAAKRSYHVGGQVAGFITDWGQLKFVTVKGAGHLVPGDKPVTAAYILDAFINNKKF
ncbi:unnamed protein product, partial [Mesorhabditis belari]|uniref:Carboxypeptidase n=1 Tax=Mesorhabditis belari TaxID=2138241 RepID=A0AAF3EU46_9BILA